MSLLISAKRETGFVDFFWFWSDCACSRRLFYSAILIFQRAVPIACTHLTNALNFNYTAYTPLRVYDWPDETTPENLARNRRGLENLIPNVCAGSHRRQSTGRASRTQNRSGRPLCYYFEARLVDSNSEEVWRSNSAEEPRWAQKGPIKIDAAKTRSARATGFIGRPVHPVKRDPFDRRVRPPALSVERL
jgi:hypothetical protein